MGPDDVLRPYATPGRLLWKEGRGYVYQPAGPYPLVRLMYDTDLIPDQPTTPPDRRVGQPMAMVLQVTGVRWELTVSGTPNLRTRRGDIQEIIGEVRAILPGGAGGIVISAGLTLLVKMVNPPHDGSLAPGTWVQVGCEPPTIGHMIR